MKSLMGFLGKEIKQLPSITTCINYAIILLWMRCWMYSPLQTLTNNRIRGIFFFTIINLTCNKWNTMPISFIKVLIKISMHFRTWHGQEYTWVELFQIPFFRGYWHWCLWQQPYMRYMLPPWLNFSLSTKMLWRRLLLIWRVSNLISIRGKMLQIVVNKSWLMLSALRVPGTLSLIT